MALPFRSERKTLADLYTGSDHMRGHPTAPGPPDDPGEPVMGGPSPGNGQPGIPLVLTSRTNRGPGVPGHTPTGPKQPGAGIPGDEF